MPIGRFRSFGNSFSNQGSQFRNRHSMGHNLMGQNPMGNGLGFPRQNLFQQIMKSPQVQEKVPNIMRGLQRFMSPSEQGGFGPNLGEGQSQMFGPGWNNQGLGQGNGVNPFGSGGFHNQGFFPSGIPQGIGGNLQRNLEVQPPSPNSSPVPDAPIKSPSKLTYASGLIRDLLGRLGIGK